MSRSHRDQARRQQHNDIEHDDSIPLTIRRFGNQRRQQAQLQVRERRIQRRINEREVQALIQEEMLQ